MKLIDFLVEYEKGIHYERIVFNNRVFCYDETYGVYRDWETSTDLMEYIRNKECLSKKVIILDTVDNCMKSMEYKIDYVEPDAVYINGHKCYDTESLANKIDELVDVINEMRCIK